ncbi:hypothetical protein ABIC21_002147 [Pseudarthrobacter sp. PvP090]
MNETLADDELAQWISDKGTSIPMIGRVAALPWKPTPRYWRSTIGERRNIRHRRRLKTSSPH